MTNAIHIRLTQFDNGSGSELCNLKAQGPITRNCERPTYFLCWSVLDFETRSGGKVRNEKGKKKQSINHTENNKNATQSKAEHGLKKEQEQRPEVLKNYIDYY